MPLRAKLLVLATAAAAFAGVWWGMSFPPGNWGRFAVYLIAVLLSSGIRVSLPRGDRKLAVNLPFILLAVVQLSPLQAILLASLSVVAECTVRSNVRFTPGQIVFNVSNIATATTAACGVFRFGRAHHLDVAPALLAAALAYFLENTLVVAMVQAWSQERSAAGLWIREFPWYLPFYLVGATLALVTQLIGTRTGWLTALLLFPVLYMIYRSYMAQRRLMRSRQQHIEEAEALHVRTIEGLAMAIEAKDHNTHEHLLRVRTYAAEIGRILGLTPDQMQALGTAAFLHDIGKLAVPEHILNKPGRLTPEEFEKMKIHTVVGADILERVRFPYPVVPIVRSHHEAWDGTGYPDGLRGEEIPIGARILSVVDCFDAMACDRPYRRALPLDQAMAFVKSRAGTQFDPRVVEVLEQHYVELERMAHAQENTLRPLETNVSVERGKAPGAGFATESTLIFDDETLLPGEEFGAPAGSDPLGLISAAGQEAQGLFEMTQMLGSSLSPDETILVMSSRLRRLVPFDCFALYLVKAGALVLHHLDGVAAGCFSACEVPLGEGLSGYVAQCGNPVVNGNPRLEPNYVAEATSPQQLESALCIPLCSPSGAVFGVLSLYAAKPDAFSREHLRVLQAVESKFALSLENALRHHTALRHHPAEAERTIDPLTELPGLREFHAALEAELNRSRRSGNAVAVAVCDLNHFRHVTEGQGRAFGDKLLCELAAAFRSACRSYDTVARVGANKFLFLFPAIDTARTDSLIEVIQSALRRALQGAGAAVDLTASLGLACFPADGVHADDLLAEADRRMHLEKRRYYSAVDQASAKEDEPAPEKAPVAKVTGEFAGPDPAEAQERAAKLVAVA